MLRRSWLNIFGLLVAGISAMGTAALAQPIKADAQRMPVAPVIDGVVDPIEWQSASKFSGMVDERTGEPMPGSATIYLGYDSEAIYFAGDFSDDRPQEIRADGYRVNEMPDSDDRFQLSIDVTGSMDNWDSFKLNARTATKFEAAGGRALKREWLGEFAGKGRITATGWETEGRIPWRLLNLPGKGPHDARFNFGRHWHRKGREYVLGFYQNGNGNNTPTWSRVEFPAPYVDRSLKLLPYFYAGVDRGLVANAGVDIKTSLASQITAIGSINPDFRNIENQILSLDFSRFERLADETRPFFLEGNDRFDSGIFTSQRIRSFDVGAKVFGRLGPKTSFGVMDAFDGNVSSDTVNPNTNQLEQGNRNDIVATFDHQQDVNTSYRLAVTGSNRPGESNSAYLLRASKDFGLWTFTVRDQGSQDSVTGFGRRSEVNASYNVNGLFIQGSVTRVADNFNPALGFVQQTDVRGYNGKAFYEKNWDTGTIRSVSSFSTYYVNMRDSRAGLYNRGAYSNVNLRVAQLCWLNLSGSVEDFEGSKDHTVSAGVSFPALSPDLSYNFGYTQGRIAGERYQQANVGYSRRWRNRFSTNLSYQVQHYFDTQRQLVASANYDIDESRSISGRLIGQEGSLGGYLSYRRSGNRGAEYFLILGDPNQAKFVTSVILKVSIPFEIKV
jgi:hypothetical protein